MSNKDQDKTLLQIRLLDGSTIRARFPINATLKGVANYVRKKAKELGHDKTKSGKPYTIENGICFHTPIPREKYHIDKFDSTLEDLKLVPSGTLIVVPSDMKELAPQKATEPFKDAMKGDVPTPPWRLKGESRDQKEAFKKKLREEEAAKKKREMEQRKKELEQIRTKIKGDKAYRKEVFG